MAVNFIINLGMYPFDVMFSFGESDDSLMYRLEKLGVDYKDSPWKFESDRVHGRTCVFESGQTLVRLPKKPKTPYEYGTLQHEIFHAVEFLFNRINVKHHVDCGECWAYLIGYITERVYKKL